MEASDYDSLSLLDLKALMKMVGLQVPVSIGHAEAVQRLRLRFLVDPYHFGALRTPMMGPGRLEAIFRGLPTRPGDLHDAKGLPGIETEVFASQLYQMMADPTSFDDLLLTLVPLGTYKAEDVWMSLIENGTLFPNATAFTPKATPDVKAAYKQAMAIVASYNRAVKQGLSMEEAIAIKTAALPFEATWVQDTGLRGQSYARLMFTMPDGSIWSTPPFGLLFDDPVLLMVQGVNIAELITIADVFEMADARGGIEEILLGRFATFTYLPRKPKDHYLTQCTNLRETVDRLHREIADGPLAVVHR